ncbi:MAG: transglycosylase SLT domain-containing protein [Bdellovibrionales bacterium]|nr:transglycosylase SLT domain-containing protein [Bdellovibrionales bacterium]
MKTLPVLQEKELFIKFVLISTLAFGVHSNIRNLKKMSVLEPVKQDNSSNDEFGNFDTVDIPNKPVVLAKMMKTLKPSIGTAKKHKLSMKIYDVLSKYDIPPQVMISIIDAESSFNQNMISSSGDLSIAQINVEVWNKEFERLKRPLIDTERLKHDERYALETMAKILTLLKNRYHKLDRRWYARYHSKTKKYKSLYLSKLEDRMKKLERTNISKFRKTTKPRILALH